MTLHVDTRGAGRDLVLLHGWGLHGGVWDEVIAPLAARFRVHAVDLPGHGASHAHPASTLDEAVDAIASVSPPGSVVCGWSLGGLAAQRLALRHPGRVAALALVSTTPRFVAGPGWSHGMQPGTLEGFADGLRHDREATLEAFVRLNALHGARERPAIRAFTRKLHERHDATGDGLARGLAWLRETDLREQVSALAMPALVVHGARDALVPAGAGRWLAQALPRARLVEVEDAAHLPFFSHPDRFLEALGAFAGEPLLHG